MKQALRFPPWLRKNHYSESGVEKMRSLLKASGLSTVCQSARCPNLGECFRKSRATFLILGSVCTRRCGFCGISKGLPGPPDPDEPVRVARLSKELNLKRVVITSVTRDDLADGGAAQFADCVCRIRKTSKDVKIELLAPDFMGSKDVLKKILCFRPDVFAHNIETVPRLYKKMRKGADYERSLMVLKAAAEYGRGIIIKSGIMVGLGERKDEVESVMNDLRKTGVQALTIGQYLRPSKNEAEVFEFIHPSVFEEYKKRALEIGFKSVLSGPFVRSSIGN